jgi:hypothetical protein
MEMVRPRTVLHVSRNGEGDVEIALVVEPGPLDLPAGLGFPGVEEKRSLVVRARDVSTLVEMLERVLDEDDPEDRSTLRNLRPVTPALVP